MWEFLIYQVLRMVQMLSNENNSVEKDLYIRLTFMSFRNGFRLQSAQFLLRIVVQLPSSEIYDCGLLPEQQTLSTSAAFTVGKLYPWHNEASDIHAWSRNRHRTDS